MIDENKIGFMQGRLTPIVNQQIQAFPVNFWRDEFRLAKKIPLSLMEWTIDFDNINENPLMTLTGRQEIQKLQKEYQLRIESVTADAFMQKPFFKYGNNKKVTYLDVIKNIVESCLDLNIKILVLPLVDNASVINSKEEETLILGINELCDITKGTNLTIAFESDYDPRILADFMTNFENRKVGINYDTGNSAALGFQPNIEFEMISKWICNVHIKDRLYKGATVPLGQGDVNFRKVFSLLHHFYNGNYIFQTARAKNDNHMQLIKQYKIQVLDWMRTYKDV